MPEIMQFPKDFLWGAAVSAYQTEGGNTRSDWWAWERSQRRRAELTAEGKDPKDFESNQACEFYDRYEHDLDLAQSLNLSAFRISVEWSRVEPSPGEYDREAIGYYKKLLAGLRERGMRTFVTLHHFTLPAWFAGMGGFLVPENIPRFVSFSRRMAIELGEYTDFWLTINEPEIYSSHAYYFGRYPPQERSLLKTMAVVHTLIDAHNQVAPVLRKLTGKPVSMAYHLTDFVASNLLARPSRAFSHWLANEYILNRTIEECDFIGVNYYGHSHISVFGRRMQSHSNHLTSDLGWGVHPEGLLRVLTALKRHNKPVYVTENGIADAADSRRWDFIREHARSVYQAIEKGVDVKGYLYWSLMDNFEWAHGYEPRFGLAEVDYRTQTRTLRPSAAQYAVLARTNELRI